MSEQQSTAGVRREAPFDLPRRIQQSDGAVASCNRGRCLASDERGRVSLLRGSFLSLSQRGSHPFRAIIIRKRVFNVERSSVQEIIVEVNEVDSLGPQSIVTRPCRLLTEDIRSLPFGIEFLRQLLINPQRFISMEK